LNTMKTQKSAILLVLIVSITLSTFCGSSYAITGNSQPDSTPYVCIVVLFADAARTQPISYSTGILIAPDIVLTAGHSVMGAAASVCFDKEPISFTVDANGLSYSTTQTIYDGEPIPYPEYLASIIAGSKHSQVLQTSDVGLIHLNTDVDVDEVASFATLPEPNLVDSLKVKTTLQVIGYGVEDPKALKGQIASAWAGSISCNSATVQLLSTNFQGSDNYLKCSANAAQGKGGIAYGDSGGPVIYNSNGENVVLAINAYVNNANCAGVSYHTRIDNPDVLDWIRTEIEKAQTT
jgi:hypothetical protein